MDDLDRFGAEVFGNRWDKRLEDGSPDLSEGMHRYEKQRNGQAALTIFFPSLGPWATRRCSETIPFIGEKIDWERPGTEWTVDQVRHLVDRFDELLDQMARERAIYLGLQGFYDLDNGFNHIELPLDMPHGSA